MVFQERVSFHWRLFQSEESECVCVLLYNNTHNTHNTHIWNDIGYVVLSLVLALISLTSPSCLFIINFWKMSCIRWFSFNGIEGGSWRVVWSVNGEGLALFMFVDIRRTGWDGLPIFLKKKKKKLQISVSWSLWLAIRLPWLTENPQLRL